MKIVVTLAEASYFQGACVLFNSLVAHGFEGIFVTGCRSLEDVPPTQRSAIEAFRSSSVRECLASWEWFCLETAWHFANYKPRFMQQVLEAYPDCDSIVYLDPDIVVCAPWHWIESSTEYGPVVAGDVNWLMPAAHPTRQAWMRLIVEAGHQSMHRFDLYFNSGLLGIHRRDRGFLDLWHHFIESFGDDTSPLDGQGPLSEWTNGGRWNQMYAPDQDALNMALMACPNSVSTFGPDMMGFAGGWTGMHHAVGKPKPWQKRFFLDAFCGRPPRMVDKAYWSNTKSPIVVYSRFRTCVKNIEIKVFSAIARIYSQR